MYKIYKRNKEIEYASLIVDALITTLDKVPFLALMRCTDTCSLLTQLETVVKPSVRSKFPPQIALFSAALTKGQRE